MHSWEIFYGKLEIVAKTVLVQDDILNKFNKKNVIKKVNKLIS